MIYLRVVGTKHLRHESSMQSDVRVLGSLCLSSKLIYKFVCDIGMEIGHYLQ